MDETICFQLIPDIEGFNPTEPVIDIDESLEIPTIEIPKYNIEHPSDLETGHKLSSEEQVALFGKVTACYQGRFVRTNKHIKT